MDIALTPAPFFTDSTEDRRRAVAALSFALVAGVGTQALFWHTEIGFDFFLWDVLAVLGTIAVFRRGRIAPTAWGAAAASVLLGFSVVLYESEWTRNVAVPTALALVAFLPLLVSDRFSLAELARLPARAGASIGRAPMAVAETARLPGVAIGGANQGLLRGVSRGLFLGVPTAGLFTLLLLGDSDFARSLEQIREKLGDVALFATWSVLNAGGYLFTHALHRARSGRPPAAEAPYRVPTARAEATRSEPSPRVTVTAWAVVVGQVTLVFAIFVVANLRHLFGGDEVVRAPGAVTYATYLHEGFGQLLFATMLSVCLVLAGHGLLRPRGERAPRAPVPGGRVLSWLEGCLLVLTGITVLSCWQRLRIYEDAYGASHLRLGVAFVELSVLGVLLLTLGKAVFRDWTGHAGAVLTLGTAIAVFASAFNTDAYVATTNLDRAAAGKALDVAYLASLSGDARSALDHPYVQARLELAERLEASYCAPRTGDLRAFRGLGRGSTGGR